MLENHMVIGDYYPEPDIEFDCGCVNRCYCDDPRADDLYYSEKYGDEI